MGSVRDSAPDANQASGAACLPLPARVWLRPLSRCEPHFPSGSRGDSPRSRDAPPASPRSAQAPVKVRSGPEGCVVAA